MPSERIPGEIMREARCIALAAAGQVNDNEDARCVETLVGRLVETALLARDKRAAEICRRIDDECGMEAGLAASCATAILTYNGGRDAE